MPDPEALIVKGRVAHPFARLRKGGIFVCLVNDSASTLSRFGWELVGAVGIEETRIYS